MAKGCHKLIRNGAKLVETVEDVLEEFKHHIDLSALLNREKIPSSSEKVHSHKSKDPQHEKVLASMGTDAKSIDEIIDACGLGC